MIANLDVYLDSLPKPGFLNCPDTLKVWCSYRHNVRSCLAGYLKPCYVAEFVFYLSMAIPLSVHLSDRNFTLMAYSPSMFT